MGSRVTLNYGLRWEPFFPQQLVNGAVYQFDMRRFQQNVKSTVFPNGPAGLYFPGDPGFPDQGGHEEAVGAISDRASGLAWDPTGSGLTTVRASYGKSFEFVNAQFHLNTSVAPPWGSEVRLNAPPGGLDNPFLGSPGGQTNIFPVTFDQNAPFSLNGPFLSLSNDMASTNGAHVERHGRTAVGRNWLVVGRLRRQPHEQHLGVDAAQQRALRAGQRRRPERRQHERPPSVDARGSGRTAGTTDPLDLYVTDGKQRYNGLLLSVRRQRGPYGSTVDRELHPVALLWLARRQRRRHDEPGSGLQQARGSGASTMATARADRLHNFSMIGRRRVAAVRERRRCAPSLRAGGWWEASGR